MVACTSVPFFPNVCMCICKQCAPFKFHREAGHALITYMYWHFWDWSWQCSSDCNFERLSGQLLATLATRQSLFGFCLPKNLWLHVGVDNEFVCSVLTGCMLMASCQVPNLDAQENDIYQMQNCKNVIVSGSGHCEIKSHLHVRPKSIPNPSPRLVKVESVF